MAAEDLDITGILVNSSRQFEKEVLRMPVVLLDDALKHMTPIYGVRGDLVVSEIRSGAQLHPYVFSETPGNSTKINPRTLTTYLSNVVEVFDPVPIYTTCFGQSIDVEISQLDIVKTISLEMAKMCCEYLALALFTGSRNAAGTTTADIFNGFDTIINTEKSTTPTGETYANISTGKNNLINLGEINSSNVGDVLLYFYRSVHSTLKRQKVKMFLRTSIREMYNDWCANNYQAVAYNQNFEKNILIGSNGMCELVDLPGMDSANNLIITTKNNMLIGFDQKSKIEKFEVRRPDNPNAVQMNMKFFIGVQLRSISERYLKVGSFTLDTDETATITTTPTSVAFGTKTVDTVNTSSLNVKGDDITGGVVVEIAGDGFSCNTSAITASDVLAGAGKDIIITFAPTSARTYNGSVAFKDVNGNILKVVAITGTGEAAAVGEGS